MKFKRVFAVLLACICLCSMTVAVKAEPSSPYRDVSTGFWGYEDVLFVTERELMMGVDVGSFAPNMTLSRGMLATVLWRVQGSPYVKQSAPFNDLTQDWYKMPVAWAAKNGIVNGVGDGRFAPEDDITREQLMVMLYRYTESCDYVMEGSVDLTRFKDQATVSSWATAAMKWGVGNGLINGMEAPSGNPILAPTATCTRAQAAAMIHRYMLKEWEPVDSGESNTPTITTPGNDTEAGDFASYANNPILLTHAGGFPRYLNLSQSLDPYINVNNKGKSPGVSEMTLEQTKWGGSYRCIAPVGAANVLWYNQTLVQQFNLLDPYTLWKQGNWNWDTYEAFMMSVPKKTAEGGTLYAFRQDRNSIFSTWSVTNGKGAVEIATESATPALINNWDDTAVTASWSFISKLFRKINYADAETAMYGRLFNDGTLLMSETGDTLFPQIDSTPYGAANQFQWVPFPDSGNANGQNAAFAYGCTMMLPKRMKVQDNAPYAVKFMELWANRFTEALYDYYGQDSGIGMNDVAKRRHYDFCLNNTYFNNQMNNWIMVTGNDKLEVIKWQTAFSKTYDMAEKTTVMRPIVDSAIQASLNYGSEIV